MNNSSDVTMLEMISTKTTILISGLSTGLRRDAHKLDINSVHKVAKPRVRALTVVLDTASNGHKPNN